MYDIFFTKNAEKFLDKVEKKDREKIIFALERLRVRPEAYLTRLVGETCYKFRVGDYRVITDLDRGRLVVIVLYIGKRERVYDI
ncbi:type II toxin-antitoxin system RelE/ParE family toxin [Candidatus Woesearchaeota archaeon]|nr:type II toxin-antitoxin system RelE/ParE family toxin [Candidatus Woesearchaeota archaeon]HIH49645.1 type II toxin-antitoxin system RelE/ParE family toxin [Candidatus Woesearchaeota archaeon]